MNAHPSRARASVCANCELKIIWMETLNTWIHSDTGRAACGILRSRVLVAIAGRREVRAAPLRRPGSTPRAPMEPYPSYLWRTLRR